MFLRLIMLFLSVPMMICGGLVEVMGVSAIPYEIRYTFPLSWATTYPAFAFFGSALVFVIALLVKTGQAVRVNDFAN